MLKSASAFVFCFSSFEISWSECSVEFVVRSAKCAFATSLVTVGVAPRAAPQFVGDDHGFGNFPH
jgi:hypothetical protein